MPVNPGTNPNIRVIGAEVIERQIQEIEYALEQHAKSVRLWIGLVMSLAGIGFTAAVYLGRFAHAEDVKAIAEKVDAIATQIAVLQERQGETTASIGWIHEELGQVAGQVGAPVVGAPQSARRRR